MTQKFSGGSIYLGSGVWTNEIYVDDGLVSEPTSKFDLTDLAGNTLVPAFRDAHAHPLFAGRELLGVDITGANSHEEIGQTLVQARRNRAELDWLVGGSYDRSLSGARNREFLDSYVSDIPVVLHAEDHHTIWVNSKALEVAGLLTREIPSVSVGGIDIGEDGLPSGILRESEAKDFVLKVIPQPSIQDDVRAILAAEDLLIASGIVSVQDAWIEPGMAEVYLSAKNQLRISYQLAVVAMPAKANEAITYANQARSMLMGASNLSVNAIKFFIDGVFGSATAAVSEPYQSTGQNGDLNWGFLDLVTGIANAHQNGYQAHIHAIGDKAVSFALDAIESAPVGPLPASIAHAELTTAKLLQRANSLGVNMVVQPYWAQNNGMLLSCTKHLGDARTNSLYAFRQMLDLGINVAFSSDWPVSSYRPLEGVAVAVHRKLHEGMPSHNPSQAISLDEALDAYSSGTLKALGLTESPLAIGSSFDAVIIEGDLRLKNLGELSSAKVLSIYKSGINLLP